METALITWWSLVHALTGVAFAAVLHYWKLKSWKSHILTFTLLLAWEFFEYYCLTWTWFGDELLRNRIADMVIGFGAYLIAYYLLIKHRVKWVK